MSMGKHTKTIETAMAAVLEAVEEMQDPERPDQLDIRVTKVTIEPHPLEAEEVRPTRYIWTVEAAVRLGNDPDGWALPRLSTHDLLVWLMRIRDDLLAKYKSPAEMTEEQLQTDHPRATQFPRPDRRI